MPKKMAKINPNVGRLLAAERSLKHFNRPLTHFHRTDSAGSLFLGHTVHSVQPYSWRLTVGASVFIAFITEVPILHLGEVL